ncbi:MAG: DUF937 domain-containing protein [Flavobacteriaceae bacterium]|nr:DUF937 domain-containing protein [Flavobacteriaceae bacterium]
MNGILDLLNSDSGKQLINGSSKQLGINKANAASALGAAIPLILGAMQNNASSPNGAKGLLGALGNSRHNGSIMDNLEGILGGDKIDDDVLADGGNILGHIFGGQQENAANAVGKTSGIDLSSVMNIMKVAAPFVMGYLGKNAMKNGVSDQNGLSGLLGGLLGDDNDNQKELAHKLQDFDNNDFSVDDIAGLMKGDSDSKTGGFFNSLKELFS